MESIQGLIIKENGWYEYKGWKIQTLDDGSYQCVRIRPTRFFRASTTLEKVCASIDRREIAASHLHLNILAQVIN